MFVFSLPLVGTIFESDFTLHKVVYNLFGVQDTLFISAVRTNEN